MPWFQASSCLLHTSSADRKRMRHTPRTYIPTYGEFRCKDCPQYEVSRSSLEERRRASPQPEARDTLRRESR